MPLSADEQMKLVEQCLPISRALARRYRGLGVDLEDLEQEGALGLVEAARLFSPQKFPGVWFGDYARSQVHKRIIQAIDASLRERTQAELPALPAPEPDPYSERAANELWSAAEILTPEDRDLLADRYGLGGRPAQGLHEMSSRRDIPFATLKRRLDDIRKRIKIELVRRGWRDRTKPQTAQAQLNIG
jgi:RNA polymerase sigma factor (sigma-70 family)